MKSFFKFFAVIAVLFMPLEAYSQISKKEIKEIRAMQNSGEYIWGTGRGNTRQQASNDALVSLSSQISTSVSSQYEFLEVSETTNDETNLYDKVNDIMKTYTHNTLSNALEIVEAVEPQYVVHRYIKVSELDKIFEERKEKAISYAREAQKYESEGNIGDALSYYYWAMALLRSCPSGDKIKITFGLDGDKLLNAYIYNCIKEILNEVQVTAVKNVPNKNGTRAITLKFTYKGNAPKIFNYTYSEGTKRSDTHIAHNGENTIVVPSSMTPEALDVCAEYYSADEAMMDPELSDVLRFTDRPPVKIARLELKNAAPTTAYAKGTRTVNHEKESTSLTTATQAQVKTVTPQQTTQKFDGTDLGYAIWSGKVKDGKPEGNGKMLFKQQSTILGTTYKADADDILDGQFHNGKLVNGDWTHNGVKKYIEGEE